jgi:uncharacterized integral membrane protein
MAMKRALQLIVLVPLIVIGLALAVANRSNVIVSFDPFSSDAAGQIQAPLFVVLILAVMFGVLLGGLATWLSQGKYRRALRDERRRHDEAGQMKV